ERRGLAGAEPQREAAAVGTAEPAAPQRATNAGGGAGAAAESRAIAGSGARSAGRRAGRTGPGNPADRCHSGGVGTPDTTRSVSLAGAKCEAHTFDMDTARRPKAILGLAALLLAGVYAGIFAGA